MEPYEVSLWVWSSSTGGQKSQQDPPEGLTAISQMEQSQDYGANEEPKSDCGANEEPRQYRDLPSASRANARQS